MQVKRIFAVCLLGGALPVTLAWALQGHAQATPSPAPGPTYPVARPDRMPACEEIGDPVDVGSGLITWQAWCVYADDPWLIVYAPDGTTTTMSPCLTEDSPGCVRDDQDQALNSSTRYLVAW